MHTVAYLCILCIFVHICAYYCILLNSNTYFTLIALAALSLYNAPGAECHCPICVTPKSDLASHQPSCRSLYPHRSKLTRELIKRSTDLSDKQKEAALKQLSMHPEDSALYGLIHPEIHLSFACDILHMLDVGLSKDIWTLVIRWLDGKEVKTLKYTAEEKLQHWTDQIEALKASIEEKGRLFGLAQAKAEAKVAKGTYCASLCIYCIFVHILHLCAYIASLCILLFFDFYHNFITIALLNVAKVGEKTGNMSNKHGDAKKKLEVAQKKVTDAKRVADAKKETKTYMVERDMGRVGSKNILERLDTRARGVEPMSGWKTLVALSSLPLITGHEMKIILQLLDILIEGLVDDEEGEDVVYFIQKYNEWYIALTAPNFGREDLENLCVLGEEVATLYLSSPLVKFSKVDLKTKKFHHMMTHAIDTIRAYGCLLTTNTSLWESFHRVLKRIARRAGNSSALLWIAEKQALSQVLNTVYVKMTSRDECKEKKVIRYQVVHQNKLAGK